MHFARAKLGRLHTSPSFHLSKREGTSSTHSGVGEAILANLDRPIRLGNSSDGLCWFRPGLCARLRLPHNGAGEADVSLLPLLFLDGTKRLPERSRVSIGRSRTFLERTHRIGRSKRPPPSPVGNLLFWPLGSIFSIKKRFLSRFYVRSIDPMESVSIGRPSGSRFQSSSTKPIETIPRRWRQQQPPRPKQQEKKKNSAKSRNED